VKTQARVTTKKPSCVNCQSKVYAYTRTFEKRGRRLRVGEGLHIGRSEKGGDLERGTGLAQWGIRRRSSLRVCYEPKKRGGGPSRKKSMNGGYSGERGEKKVQGLFFSLRNSDGDFSRDQGIGAGTEETQELSKKSKCTNGTRKSKR